MKRLLFLLLSTVFAIVLKAQPTNPPNLLAPVNNAVGQKSTIYIRWDLMVGVTRYIINVDTLASFGNPFIDSIYAPGINLTDLKFGKKYYWRVRAANAAGYGPWSSPFNFTVFSLPSVSTPQASPSTDFPVKGYTFHTANGAKVEYQFDTLSNFSSDERRTIRTTQADITTAFYSGLLHRTKYYVRARAYHSNDTTAWTPNRIVTTSYALIYGPANNSTQTTFRITYAYVKTSSYVPDTGIIYQLQLDTSPTFSNPIMDIYDDSSSYSDSVLSRYRFGTKYYFRVRSMHYRDTSDWNSIAFNTFSTPWIYRPGTTPQKPEKLVIIPFDHPGVDYFIYDLDTGYNVGSPNNLSDTIIQWKAYPIKLGPYLKFGQRYTLGMRAVKGHDTSEMGKVTFLVLSTIALSSPSDNGLNYPVKMTFSWSNSMGDISYQIRLDTSASFGSPVERIVNVASNTNSQLVQDLWYGKKIYWSVRGTNPIDSSAWSSARNFTTPIKASLIGPTNGTVNYDKNNNLGCNGIEGSRYYEFQVSTDSLFAGSLSDTTQNNQSSGAVYLSLSSFNLNHDTKYFWRVRAINFYDSSAWSDTWKFTTKKGPPRPKKVTLLSPQHNVITVPYYPYIIKFTWTVDSNESYQFQLGKSSNFSSLQEIGFVFGTAQMEIDSLTQNTWYYWRVRAENSEEDGPWSDTFAFKTLPAITPPFVLWPDNETDMPLSQNLDWEDIDGASAYDYRINTSPTLSGAIIKSVNVSEAVPVGLLLNTHYYWQVRAKNTYYSTAWSFVADFYTVKVNSTTELSGNMLICYPVPAEDILNIELPGQGKTELEMFDITGRLMLKNSQEATGKMLKLDLQHIPAGVYSVRLYQNGQAYYFKFVK